MPKMLARETLGNELSYIESQLNRSDLPFTLRKMWEGRKEEVESELRGSERGSSTAASVALIFEGGPVRGQEAIEVDFASQALDSFQDLLSSVYAERVIAQEIANRGPVRGKRKSKLFLEEIIHGSMGFILSEEPNEQADAFPTALSEALDESINLIRIASSEGEDGFSRLLENTAPRAILSLKKLTDVIHQGGAIAKIASNTTSMTLNSPDVDRMFVRLHEFVRDSELVFIEGVLNGIFPDEDRFEFLDIEIGRIMHGKADRALVDRYLTDGGFRSAYLTTPIIGQFKRTVIRQPGHEDKVSFLLESVGPLRARPLEGPSTE